jgi:putative DNA primase/helicase
MTYALKVAAGSGSADYVPAPVALDSLFGRFLNTSMPDVDNQAYLQELMGYTLSSSTEHQVAIILKGGGQNGKSVLMRLATSLQGNPQTLRLDQLSGFGLSPVVGASMLVSEEMPARGIDEQTFKAIVSGEGLHIDRKHIRPITYYNTAKLLIATNHDLRSSDNSHGLWRRQAIIAFDHQIDRDQVIPNLANKIIAQELKVYLDWCLMGLQRLLQRTRLPDPTASMVKAKRTAILASDPVARWVDEQSVKVSSSALIFKADVFEAYAKWCRANGERAGNSSAFWKSAASHLKGMKSSQARQGGQRHYFVNLSLGDDLEMDTQSPDNPFGDSEA